MHLEAEVQRCVKQNRRMKALIFPVLALAATPFLLAWSKGSSGVFDTVTASQVVVKNGDRTLAILGSSYDSGGGGSLLVFGPDRKVVGRIESTRDNSGKLSLFGPNPPRYKPQVEIAVSRQGNGSLSLHTPAIPTTASVYLSTDGRGVGYLSFSNPGPKGGLLSLGADNKGDAYLSLSDADGKVTSRLDAFPKSISAGTVSLKRGLPGRNLNVTGGGGRLTLTDTAGTATFRAPTGATGN